MRRVLIALERLVAQEDLISWENTIRTKFDADNAHLLMGSPMGEAAVKAVVRRLPLLYPYSTPSPAPTPNPNANPNPHKH